MGESEWNECTLAECEVSVVSTGQGRRVRGGESPVRRRPWTPGSPVRPRGTAIFPRLSQEVKPQRSQCQGSGGSRGQAVRTKHDQEKQQQGKQSQEETLQELEKESRKGLYFKEEIDVITFNC